MDAALQTRMLDVVVIITGRQTKKSVLFHCHLLRLIDLKYVYVCLLVWGKSLPNSLLTWTPCNTRLETYLCGHAPSVATS